MFRNIRIIEYDTSDNIVDSVYPVGRLLRKTYLDISSYGKKYKKYYGITLLKSDSMEIEHSDLYVKEKSIKVE